MEEKRNGRKKAGAIIAVAAGLAMLATGGTYALWSASGTIAGGTIKAGDLNLTAGTAVYWDVTTNRADEETPIIDTKSNPLTFTEDTPPDYVMMDSDVLTGHKINSNSTWLMVPDDTVAVVMPFDIVLKGDNLVAKLTLDASTLLDSKGIVNNSYSYAFFGVNGEQIGETTALTSSTKGVVLATVQANNDGQLGGVDDLDGNGDLIPVVAVDGTATVTVVVFAHFAYSTPDRVDTNNVDDLAKGVKVTLEQVRN